MTSKSALAIGEGNKHDVMELLRYTRSPAMYFGGLEGPCPHPSNANLKRLYSGLDNNFDGTTKDSVRLGRALHRFVQGNGDLYPD